MARASPAVRVSRPHIWGPRRPSVVPPPWRCAIGFGSVIRTRAASCARLFTGLSMASALSGVISSHLLPTLAWQVSGACGFGQEFLS